MAAKPSRLVYSTGTGQTCPKCGWPVRDCRCGTAVEARWFCPTCGVAVTDSEISAGDETRLV